MRSRYAATQTNRQRPQDEQRLSRWAASVHLTMRERFAHHRRTFAVHRLLWLRRQRNTKTMIILMLMASRVRVGT